MNPKYKDLILPLLASFLLIIFSVVVIILMFHPIPKDNSQLVDVVIQSIEGMCLMAIGYYFGSSKGSSDKNEVIANSAPPVSPQEEVKPATNQN